MGNFPGLRRGRRVPLTSTKDLYKKLCKSPIVASSYTPEQQREYRRRWRLKNKDKVSEAKRRRRLAELGIVGSHTREEWLECLVAYNGQCAKCGSTDKITRDHIIPITKGGSDYIDNIQPLCAPCNSRKGNRI